MRKKNWVYVSFSSVQVVMVAYFFVVMTSQLFLWYMQCKRCLAITCLTFRLLRLTERVMKSILNDYWSLLIVR